MNRFLVMLLLMSTVAACGGVSHPVRPTDPLAHISAAQLYQRGQENEHAGDHVRAEQYYAAALTRGYEDAMLPLLRVCVTSDRYGAALRYAQGQLEARPDSWQLRYLTAELLGAVGRTDDERAELETLVSDVSERPDPHYALAELYRNEGENRRAAYHYRRYLALAPTGNYARAARVQRTELRRQRAEERREERRTTRSRTSSRKRRR